jgi:6-phosphofructokinase 1
MIDPVTKKTEVRLVDVKSDSYNVARNYMVRLDKEDLEDRDFLKMLSGAAGMTEQEFAGRYGYLVKT